MRNLLLIKHSMPEIQPDVSPHDWRLGEQGRRQCKPLAELLRGYDLSHFYSSTEPKAAETAELVCRRLQRSFESLPDFREHDRGGVGFLGEKDFTEGIRMLFERPGELVFGGESADQVAMRVGNAVDELLGRHVQGNIAIFSHGTAIAAFAGHRCQIDPFDLWQRLKLPSVVVLSLPEFSLLDVVEEVC